MTRGQDSLLIDHVEVPDLAADGGNGLRAIEIDLPVVEPSAAELEAHQQYLAARDKAVKGECLWRKYG